MLNKDLYSNMYNPDVLSTLANLSSDEVFTPPEVVNQMLDLLPEDLWSNPKATFLDIILQRLIQLNYNEKCCA